MNVNYFSASPFLGRMVSENIGLGVSLFIERSSFLFERFRFFGQEQIEGKFTNIGLIPSLIYHKRLSNKIYNVSTFETGFSLLSIDDYNREIVDLSAGISTGLMYKVSKKIALSIKVFQFSFDYYFSTKKMVKDTTTDIKIG